jgi:hypothetical protein
MRKLQTSFLTSDNEPATRGTWKFMTARNSEGRCEPEPVLSFTKDMLLTKLLALFFHVHSTVCITEHFSTWNQHSSYET